MTIEPSESLLREVTVRILEDAAFLLIDPTDDFDGWAEEVVEARIAFSGPLVGTVRLVACRRLAVEIAANMLGIDELEPDAQASDGLALGELVNIVAGAMVARLCGTRVACDLGLPNVATAGGASWPRPGVIASAFRDEEGRAIGVELVVAGVA